MANPFMPPGTNGTASTTDAPDLDTIHLHLAKMRPWQNLIGWVATVGAVLQIGMLALVSLASLAGGNIAGLFCVIPLYGVMAWVYWSLGASLRASAQHIQFASMDDTAFNLEESLRYQAEFWNVAGILTLLSLAASAVGVVIIIGLTMLGGALNSQFGF